MFLGGWRLLTRRGQAAPTWNVIAGMTLLLTIVVLAFYISPYASHNYGGVTNGPRWLLWLTPLWLVTMLPVVDVLGKSRWGRAVSLVLLAFSVFSASYSLWNPWRHPWIYDLMNARGLIPY